MFSINKSFFLFFIIFFAGAAFASVGLSGAASISGLEDSALRENRAKMCAQLRYILDMQFKMDWEWNICLMELIDAADAASDDDVMQEALAYASSRGCSGVKDVYERVTVEGKNLHFINFLLSDPIITSSHRSVRLAYRIAACEESLASFWNNSADVDYFLRRAVSINAIDLIILFVRQQLNMRLSFRSIVEKLCQSINSSLNNQPCYALQALSLKAWIESFAYIFSGKSDWPLCPGYFLAREEFAQSIFQESVFPLRGGGFGSILHWALERYDTWSCLVKIVLSKWGTLGLNTMKDSYGRTPRGYIEFLNKNSWADPLRSKGLDKEFAFLIPHSKACRDLMNTGDFSKQSPVPSASDKKPDKSLLDEWRCAPTCLGKSFRDYVMDNIDDLWSDEWKKLSRDVGDDVFNIEKNPSKAVNNLTYLLFCVKDDKFIWLAPILVRVVDFSARISTFSRFWVSQYCAMAGLVDILWDRVIFLRCYEVFTAFKESQDDLLRKGLSDYYSYLTKFHSIWSLIERRPISSRHDLFLQFRAFVCETFYAKSRPLGRCSTYDSAFFENIISRHAAAGSAVKAREEASRSGGVVPRALLTEKPLGLDMSVAAAAGREVAVSKVASWSDGVLNILKKYFPPSDEVLAGAISSATPKSDTSFSFYCPARVFSHLAPKSKQLAPLFQNNFTVTVSFDGGVVKGRFFNESRGAFIGEVLDRGMMNFMKTAYFDSSNFSEEKMLFCALFVSWDAVLNTEDSAICYAIEKGALKVFNFYCTLYRGDDSFKQSVFECLDRFYKDDLEAQKPFILMLLPE